MYVSVFNFTSDSRTTAAALLAVPLLCTTMYTTIDTTSKLNLMISEIIDEVILNWDNEDSKITVESF